MISYNIWEQIDGSLIEAVICEQTNATHHAMIDKQIYKYMEYVHVLLKW